MQRKSKSSSFLLLRTIIWLDKNKKNHCVFCLFQILLQWVNDIYARGRGPIGNGNWVVALSYIWWRHDQNFNVGPKLKARFSAWQDPDECNSIQIIQLEFLIYSIYFIYLKLYFSISTSKKTTLVGLLQDNEEKRIPKVCTNMDPLHYHKLKYTYILQNITRLNKLKTNVRSTTLQAKSTMQYKHQSLLRTYY